MADKRHAFPVDYAQLHNVSSVVLYDTSSRKSKRSKLYDVERIIERRKTKHVPLGKLLNKQGALDKQQRREAGSFVDQDQQYF